MLTGRFQILFVDDSPADAELLKRALSEAGTRAQLYWVASAEEGLEFLRQEGRFRDIGPVALVISDLNLTGEGDDGFGFLSRVRQHQAFSGIPFILMSGSKNPRDIQKAYRLGASTYIIKPMTFETFRSKMETLIRYWLDVAELPDARFLD